MDRPTLRRTLTHALAGAALLVTTLAASPPGGVAQSAAAAPGCDPGNAQARVVAGRQGVDPNTVSVRESRRMEANLQSRVDRLVAKGLLRPNGTLAKAQRITVPVHFHVITASDGSGQVSSKQIRAQIRVLNDAYGGRTSPAAANTPFRFKLVSTDVTVNDDWYFWRLSKKGNESKSSLAAKRALHQGGWGDLNIYTANLSGGLLGYSWFPSHGKLIVDGIVLLTDSLPGGDAAPYNEGDTATHEIGHWLGLFHTFQNGCKTPGDHVADTPYQNDGNNVFFCNDKADTCKQPGKDPVHNFMSYGDDPCLDQFTPGQGRRMVETWRAYRR